MAKASEWIECLTALVAEHGDLEVIDDNENDLDLPEHSPGDETEACPAAFVTGTV